MVLETGEVFVVDTSEVLPYQCTSFDETFQQFRSDTEHHLDTMMKLEKAGTYLRYFGRKQDTVYIRTLLISTKLRWKKLIRHMDERGRLLTQAHREDKRVSLKQQARYCNLMN